MKLLFDQNLSPRLAVELAGLFPGSEHVQNLGLDREPDGPVWEYARSHGFVIVTKDADFSDRSALAGHPPKVLWVRLGNCTTTEIEVAIRRHMAEIKRFGTHSELGVLALFG